MKTTTKYFGLVVGP